MTSSQSVKMYEIFQRDFNNDADAKVVVEQIDEMVSDQFEKKAKDISSKTDVELLRKDMDVMRIELLAKIENSSLRVENNLKSEINKLIVWIIATMFGAGALFITIAKLFFT